jgi:hypothetical protein
MADLIQLKMASSAKLACQGHVIAAFDGPAQQRNPVRPASNVQPFAELNRATHHVDGHFLEHHLARDGVQLVVGQCHASNVAPTRSDGPRGNFGDDLLP